jgi:hypothetical protein
LPSLHGGSRAVVDPVAERFFAELAVEHVDLWDGSPAPTVHARVN